MRRAVVRAAVSATRVPSTKTSMLGVVTKIAVPRTAIATTVRCFSQTLRFASEDSFGAMQQNAHGGGEPTTDTALSVHARLLFVGARRAGKIWHGADMNL